MPVVFYALVCIADVCYKILTYALIVGEYCSGTERGAMRFFRLCDEALEAWYNYFNTGEAKHFFALMSGLPESETWNLETQK